MSNFSSPKGNLYVCGQIDTNYPQELYQISDLFECYGRRDRDWSEFRFTPDHQTAVANGVVYVGSHDDNVYAFDLP